MKNIDRLRHPGLRLLGGSQDASGLDGSLSGNSRLSSPISNPRLRTTRKPALPSIPHSFWNSQTIVPPLPPIPETRPQPPVLDPDMEWEPRKKSAMSMMPLGLRTNRQDRCNAFAGMNRSQGSNTNGVRGAPVDFSDLSDTIAQIRAMAQGPARNAIRECEEKAAREVSAMHASNPSMKRDREEVSNLDGGQIGEKMERAKKRRRLLKNRESAQRSRDKKARYIKCLEHKILEEIEEKIILQKRNQMLLHQCMKLREAYQQQTKESVQIIAQLRLQLAEAVKVCKASRFELGTSITDRITCSLGNVMMQRLKQEAKASETRPVNVKNPSSVGKSRRLNDLPNLSSSGDNNDSGTLAREALAELIRQREILQEGLQSTYGTQQSQPSQQTRAPASTGYILPINPQPINPQGLSKVYRSSPTTPVKQEPSATVGLPRLPVVATKSLEPRMEKSDLPALSTTPTCGSDSEETKRKIEKAQADIQRLQRLINANQQGIRRYPERVRNIDEDQLPLLSKMQSSNNCWDSPKVAPKAVQGDDFLSSSHSVDLPDDFSLSTL